MVKRHRPKVGFTVDPDVAERLRQRSDDTGEAQSKIVERAIRVELEREPAADSEKVPS